MATSTPTTITNESGTTAAETIQIYTQAVRDTARQVGSWALPLGTIALIALGLWALGRVGVAPARNPRRHAPKQEVMVHHLPGVDKEWRVSVLVAGRYETAATFNTEAEAAAEAASYRARFARGHKERKNPAILQAFLVSKKARGALGLARHLAAEHGRGGVAEWRRENPGLARAYYHVRVEDPARLRAAGYQRFRTKTLRPGLLAIVAAKGRRA